MIEGLSGKMKWNQAQDIVQGKRQVILSKDPSKISKIRKKKELGIYLCKKLGVTS